MEQTLLFFENYPEMAIIISIVINIFISVIGVIPSIFLTGANITFFGFWYGTFISFLGESIGSIISFYVYRKGFRKVSQKINEKEHVKVEKLLNAKGIEAFYLILGFRLLPFVPSGIVNIFAALGKVKSYVFIIASSIGKIPALIIEAYSFIQVARFEIEGKIILTLVSMYLFVKVFNKLKKRKEG